MANQALNSFSILHQLPGSSIPDNQNTPNKIINTRTQKIQIKFRRFIIKYQILVRIE